MKKKKEIKNDAEDAFSTPKTITSAKMAACE